MHPHTWREQCIYKQTLARSLLCANKEPHRIHKPTVRYLCIKRTGYRSKKGKNGNVCYDPNYSNTHYRRYFFQLICIFFILRRSWNQSERIRGCTADPVGRLERGQGECGEEDKTREERDGWLKERGGGGGMHLKVTLQSHLHHTCKQRLRYALHLLATEEVITNSDQSINGAKLECQLHCKICWKYQSEFSDTMKCYHSQSFCSLLAIQVKLSPTV